MDVDGRRRTSMDAGSTWRTLFPGRVRPRFCIRHGRRDGTSLRVASRRPLLEGAAEKRGQVPRLNCATRRTAGWSRHGPWRVRGMRAGASPRDRSPGSLVRGTIGEASRSRSRSTRSPREPVLRLPRRSRHRASARRPRPYSAASRTSSPASSRARRMRSTSSAAGGRIGGWTVAERMRPDRTIAVFMRAWASPVGSPEP